MVGQPCALAYGDDSLVLTVLAGDGEEAFNFNYDTIDRITSNTRLLVSENNGLDRTDPQTYENLIMLALFGVHGYALARSAEFSNQSFRNTIGKVDYNHLFELTVNYHTQDGSRKILINVYGNPSGFIKYFDNIKK